MARIDVTALAEIADLTAVEARAEPGDMGVPLERPPGQAETFLLLAGTLVFRFGDDERVVEPQTWVYVPPTAPYTLAVTGDEPARFLVLQTPSTGLDADPVVRRAGGSEGERVTDRPDRRATILVEVDDIIVSEFAYGAGEPGAEPHIHHTHADGFLVVEGAFTFAHRDGPVTPPARTLMLIPPDAVHGFENASDAPARCFNFHVPASGFGDYLRGRNPGFDQHDPPGDATDTPSIVVARLME